jgi:hypothetical protein
MSPERITSWNRLESALKSYHPLFIEGPTEARDQRCPSEVANILLESLSKHIEDRKIHKPLLLISQGDPIADTGVSAIMDIVAERLNIQKCLVCLDEDMDPNHAKDANRNQVQFECRYKLLLKYGRCYESSSSNRQIQESIEEAYHVKNNIRMQNGLSSLHDYTIMYACLQEMTKAKIKDISGEITVCHTSNDISEFSITSFYKVGLELGIIQESEMVYYN